MATSIQLELFQQNDDFSLLCREDTKLGEKIENYKKSYHVANEYMCKLIHSQQEELNILRKYLVESLGANLPELTLIPLEKKKRVKKKKEPEMSLWMDK